MGDTITASVAVVVIIIEKNRVRLKTVCEDQNGVQVLNGAAFVSPPKLPKT